MAHSRRRKSTHAHINRSYNRMVGNSNNASLYSIQACVKCVNEMQGALAGNDPGWLGNQSANCNACSNSITN